MVIGIIGESCSGKTTLANAINQDIRSVIVTGNEYLKMAKSESEAKALFREKLSSTDPKDSIIYVISEPDQLGMLPEGAFKILMKTDLDTIKARFKERMHGNLPAPVEAMLERKHGMFDGEAADYCFDGESGDVSALCEIIKSRM